MSDLTQLHPILLAAFNRAVPDFTRDHPTLPVPHADCIYRSPELQNATYAQGRAKTDAHSTQQAKVNALRKLAHADPISVADSAQVVTHAIGGQSAHNYLPCPALDVKFLDAKGNCDWHPALFALFAPYMLRDARIEWGGHWPANKRDLPHFDVKGWQSFVHR